jgi:predicted transcriptional regulator
VKRDFDLIRQILRSIEDNPRPNEWISIEVDGFDEETISYHVKLLHEAGLIEAKDLTTKDGFNWMPVSLTWQGHEFLDAAKNETVWKKLKKAIADKGGSLPFEIVKALAIGFAKEITLGNSGN